jgi:hypothetical protein
VDMPRSQLGRIDHGHWSGRGDGNDQPDQRRESEPGKGSNLEPEGMARLKIADRSEGQQEDGSRGRCQHNQRNINQTVQLLTAAAVLAGGEVQLVVFAHFRRQAGDIIPPSRKNFPYDGFDTHTHTRSLPRAQPSLQPDGRQGFRLSCQQHAIVPQTLAAAEGLFGRSPRDFGMVILFR